MCQWQLWHSVHESDMDPMIDISHWQSPYRYVVKSLSRLERSSRRVLGLQNLKESNVALTVQRHGPKVQKKTACEIRTGTVAHPVYTSFGTRVSDTFGYVSDTMTHWVNERARQPVVT
jgi:hypothetical protein